MRTHKLELLAVALVLSACSDPDFNLGENGGTGGGTNESSGGAAGTTHTTGGKAANGGRTAVGSGGASGSTGTNGGSANGGSAGLSGLDQFSELKLRASGGFVEPKPEDGECQPVDDEYNVDATTGEFSWRECLWVTAATRTTRYSSGKYTLSDDQIAELRQDVAGFTAPGDVCGADKDESTLDLTVDGEVRLLQDDFYACDPPKPGRSYVGNMDPLTESLRRFARRAPIPDPQTIELVSQGGGPFPPVSPDSECDPSTFANTYTLNVPERSFKFSECVAESKMGLLLGTRRGDERAVSAEEVESVVTALGELQEGSDNLCGADKPLVTLDIDTPAKLYQYVDSFYSCQPPPDGRTFVKNIDAVSQALRKLIQ